MSKNHKFNYLANDIERKAEDKKIQYRIGTNWHKLTSASINDERRYQAEFQLNVMYAKQCKFKAFNFVWHDLIRQHSEHNLELQLFLDFHLRNTSNKHVLQFSSPRQTLKKFCFNLRYEALLIWCTRTNIEWKFYANLRKSLWEFVQIYAWNNIPSEECLPVSRASFRQHLMLHLV
jgi:hypothetical protein